MTDHDDMEAKTPESRIKMIGEHGKNPDDKGKEPMGAVPGQEKRKTFLGGSETSRVHLTFRAKRKYPPDTRLHSLMSYANSMLMEGRPKAAVATPPELPVNEWLAINSFLYFNKANYFYGYIQEVCTCERMSIGPKYEYLWADGKTIRTPISVPANDYIDSLMTWIEANFDDPKLFPEYDGGKHQKGYVDAVKSIFKRIFRVFGHMQVDHPKDLELYGLVGEFDATFKTLVEFIKAFKLMDRKSLQPIQKTLDKWKQESKAAH